MGGMAMLGVGGIASKFLFPQRPIVSPLPRGSSSPVCEGRSPTASDAEGPYYAPASPNRNDLRSAQHGGRDLLLRGRVLDRACRPMGGAVVDVWHADPRGRYDNVDYGYRGHFFAESDGSYVLRTTLPASYVFEGFFRAPHIHVKARAENTPLLTTQIYFPLDPEKNARDMQFDPARLVTLHEAPDVLEATFDFVLEAG